MKCDQKLCVLLIEADVFNKAMQANIPKPLRTSVPSEYIKVLWRNGLCRRKFTYFYNYKKCVCRFA